MATEFIDIRRFDPRTIKPGSIILVLGERGTGKTTFVINCLLHSFRAYPLGVVMAGTRDTESEYTAHVPSTLVYNGFHSDKIREIIRQQESRAETRVGRKSKPAAPIFLILDDLTFLFNQINKDIGIRELVFNGRHFNCTMVIVAHYCMQIRKELRGQFDYIFTTFQKNPGYRSQIRECFDVGFPNDKAFHKIMEKCTKRFGIMVLDKRARADYGLSDSLFQFRAAKHLKFRIGNKTLWEMHERANDPDFDRSNKGGVNVVVLDS